MATYEEYRLKERLKERNTAFWVGLVALAGSASFYTLIPDKPDEQALRAEFKRSAVQAQVFKQAREQMLPLSYMLEHKPGIGASGVEIPVRVVINEEAADAEAESTLQTRLANEHIGANIIKTLMVILGLGGAATLGFSGISQGRARSIRRDMQQRPV